MSLPYAEGSDHAVGRSAHAVERFRRVVLARDNAVDCAKGKWDVKEGSATLSREHLLRRCITHLELAFELPLAPLLCHVLVLGIESHNRTCLDDKPTNLLPLVRLYQSLSGLSV